jgi:uncharacterized Fe-S center protein
LRHQFAHWHLHSHVRDNNIVQGNIFRGCKDGAITVEGNNALVSDNSIFGCDDCIDIGKLKKCDATGGQTEIIQLLLETEWKDVWMNA